MSDGTNECLLSITKAERDLGVIIDPLLTFEDHIQNVVKKANKICGLLMRTIHNKDKDIMVPLFKSLVRPILEYGNAVWCPYMRKHIDLIEGVQKRFTKRIIGMSSLDYEQRLVELQLFSLEYRRLRGDLIEVFKITHELYDTTTTKSLFKFSRDDRVRGHQYKMTKSRMTTKWAQSFFVHRVVNVWNELDSTVVNIESVDGFKKQLDIIFEEKIYTTNLQIYN